MTSPSGVDPRIVALAKAIGMVDGDGNVNQDWFADPISRLRGMVANPVQRRALLDLLDLALPPVAGLGRPGESWHPLFEKDPFGLYLTVAGDVLGVAARAGTGAGDPTAALVLTLPLVDAASELTVIAGTAAGPLEVRLDLATTGIDASVLARVELDGGGSVRIVLRDIDLGDGLPRTVELDPAALDAGAAPVLVALVREALERIGVGNNPVVVHLPGVLGLIAGVPALPFARLGSDPTAFRDWIGALTADPAVLRTWFGHLAGLAGADPTIAGEGTEEQPFRAVLLAIADGPRLVLTLARTGSGDTGRVLIGLRAELTDGTVRLDAGATLAAIATGGTAAAVILPEAGMSLAAVPQLPPSGTVQIGSVTAGLRWQGAAVQPHLALHQVTLGGNTYPVLDLSSADAVETAAATAIGDALSQLLGPTGPGHALAALIGLVPPAADPTSPHRVAIADLASAPTRAIAAFHRAVLDDPGRWSALLAELAALAGLDGEVSGTGSGIDPWRVRLASAGSVKVDLAAWDERGSADPHAHGLRIGFQLDADTGWVDLTARAGLLGFDLTDGPTATALLPGVALTAGTVPPAVVTPGGTRLDAQRAWLQASWRPGTALRIDGHVADLTLRADGERLGPVDITVPAPGGFDPTAPDLGIGVPPDVLAALLRLLVAEAALGWGGPRAAVTTALLGLHRRLPGLPGDWPVLLSGRPDDDLAALLRDPVPALRNQLRQLATGVSSGGIPFAVPALRWLTAVLGGADTLDPALLPPLPAGWGTEEHPWRLVLPADDRVELLLWTGETGPGPGWAEAYARHLLDAETGTALVERLRVMADPLPAPSAALHGREPETLGDAVDALARWCADSDGVVPHWSQVAVGPAWQVGETLTCAHQDLPGDPNAIAQVRHQLDAAAAPDDRCVLLVSAPFADHRAWRALLAEIDPEHAPDAHFHLRVPGVDPMTVDLAETRAVSPTYTVDLADRNADPLSLQGQLGRVVERARALTGHPRVHLVAHSTAGVTARAFAAAHPDRVAGVITLGTPHAGSPLTPVTDAGLADAVRFAATLAPDGRTAPLRAVAFLAGGPATAAFAGLPGDHADAATPGFAVCAVAGPALVPHLAAEVARQVYDVAAGPATEALRTLALGLSVRPTVPDVAARVRVPLAEVLLDPTAPPVPRRRRLQAEAWLSTSDGWLVPGRVRAARVGVTISSAGDGGRTVTPIADLHDVTLGGPIEPLVSFDAALRRLGDRTAPLPLGTVPGLVVNALRTAGLVPAGADVLDPAALRQLAAVPAAYLAGAATALADLLLPTVGVTGPVGGPWRVALPQFGTQLTVSAGPWTATLVPLSSAGHLPPVQLTGTLSLPSGVTEADATARSGALAARWTAATGRLTAEIPGWVDPIVLLPTAATPAVPPGAPAALAYAALDAVASLVAGALLPEGRKLLPLGRLLAAPAAFLTGRGILAGPGGDVDPTRLNDLLGAAGDLLGLDTTHGLALPGGLTVHAVADPVRLMLTATIELGPDERLEIGAGVGLTGPGAGAPTGQLSLTRAVPGDWTSVTVTVGVDRHGLALSVTPAGATPITLLPQVDGVGALAGAATRLLPQVLQAMVAAVKADGPPGPVFDGALAVAAALGIYGDDADGFLRADRTAELARMLQPGWLESRTASASDVATLIVDLLQAIDLPFDRVEDLGSAVRATVGLAGGSLAVTAGWSTTGSPIVLVDLAGIDLGPVLIEQACLGYDGELHAHLRVGLRPPAPVAFLRPSLDVDLDVDVVHGRARFAVRVLPFGAAEASDAAITLAPVPGVVMTEDGAIALVQRWAVPLVATIVLAAFADDLDTPWWAHGPSALSILTAAGVVVTGPDGPEVAADPPPVPEMALRGLAALAGGLSVPLADLHVALVAEGGRYGVRLTGRQPVDAGDLRVSLRFGDTDWLTDPAAGVTLWLLADPPSGTLPALRPALQLTGLGVVLSGRDAPLLDTSLRIRALGVFAFATANFVDPHGAPAVSVTGLGAGAQLDDAHLVLSAADADSFIAQLLPSDVEAPLDLAVSWRQPEGLRLHRAAAAGGLELTIPLDVRAALFQLTEMWLRLGIGAGTTAVAAAVSGKADLGPLHLVVKRVGIEARFGATGAGLAFRAPDGAGLSLDAGVVSGGGYLAHDEALHQYSGAVQLQFAAVSLKAVGIITTRAPDGSPGFSLLIIIAAEFTPIQLGFGFTLIGVGGLLGLNRTTDLPVLRAGVREGTLGSVLFPTDLVANAPKVISDLNRVFPQAPGRFLIGPMGKLAWGTPPIITVTLGVILDLPAPVRLIIMGRIRMVLPDERDAVVALNLDVLGTVDFDRGELSFDASLFDSRVAAFDITGDMALRASWGRNPMFALSAGGFHPRFRAPVGFPALRRLTISLATGDNPRIRLESYLALTSNTAQFGARLELYAEASGFNIQGWLGFDALFQFEPFAFEVDITGGVQLRHGNTLLFAVTVELHLSGPRPWHAHGLATFHVLFIDVSVAFEVTFGRPDAPPLPEPADVATMLETALADVRSWSAQLPASSDTLVTLREITPGARELLAHPLGTLAFTQRVVPLATVIERFGTARPKDDTRFDVKVFVNGPAATVEAIQEEQFAPGQFFVLTDDERLNQPSFRRMPAGQRLATSTTGRDRWQVRAAPLDYEEKVMDEPDGVQLTARAARRPRLRRLTGDQLAVQVQRSAAAASPARRAGAGRFAGPSLGLGVTE
ncbi:alpha/beta fold hydrolase [Micromonospora sp. CPCC 205739]|uniref:alpha/beta fold hydrolase n=1 Tax=Micromonospora sp. CPCC 205739 TaxID=3122404 RepID=UPI002FF2BB7E